MDPEGAMNDPGPRTHSIWWLYLLGVLALLPFGFGARARTVAAAAATATFLLTLHERTEGLARLPLAALALWIGLEEGRGCPEGSCWLPLLHVLLLSLVAAASGYGYMPAGT